jgi:hypothetical protein
MSAAMSAVVGVVGSFAAPFTASYRYNTLASDPRGQIEIEGLISLNADSPSSAVIAFMAGVQVRGNPIVIAQMNRTTFSDDKPIPVQLRYSNTVINGQAGVSIAFYLISGTAANPYATLGANGGASPAGVPQWISIGPLTLPHA